MKRLLLLLLLIPVCVNGQDIDPGAYRWSNGEVKGWERKAVELIDAGEIKILQDIYIHSFSVVCVDGVKVYTTIKTGASAPSSIIIPGPCGGPQVQQQENQQGSLVQEVDTRSGRKMVTW